MPAPPVLALLDRLRADVTGRVVGARDEVALPVLGRDPLVVVCVDRLEHALDRRDGSFLVVKAAKA